TRSSTLFPCTTLFRSCSSGCGRKDGGGSGASCSPPATPSPCRRATRYSEPIGPCCASRSASTSCARYSNVWREPEAGAARLRRRDDRARALARLRLAPCAVERDGLPQPFLEVDDGLVA